LVSCRHAARTSQERASFFSTVWALVADAALDAGYTDISPHTLRHSWACWLYYDKGVNLVKVSKLLNHQRLDTTLIYLGVPDHDLVNSVDFEEEE
jgi:site-specific recombinase XerD